MLDVPAGSTAAKAGLHNGELIIACNGRAVRTVNDLRTLQDQAAGRKLTLAVIDREIPLKIELGDYAYVVMESQATAEFKVVPLAAASAVLPAKISAGGAVPRNDPVEALIDGKVVKGFGPIFANGVIDGAYKLDLGTLQRHSPGQYVLVRRREPRQAELRALRQRRHIRPRLEHRQPSGVHADHGRRHASYCAGRIRGHQHPPQQRRAAGQLPLAGLGGTPVTGEIGGENTAFQELQVVPVAAQR